MRGKLHRADQRAHVPGSIPARAGETVPPSSILHWQRVYPRPCGGNLDLDELSFKQEGLSPPVRGKPHLSHSSLSFSGLSPPVRGKPRSPLDRRTLGRSIPARAGETPSIPGVPSMPRVYPRPCGGNVAVAMAGIHGLGLSPPVRGKLTQLSGSSAFLGSIPARAGETWLCGLSSLIARVYPRPCGGNGRNLANNKGALGLSPPVRGKHRPRGRHILGRRSIPARAGETSIRVGCRASSVVYPRPCGGNLTYSLESGPSWGLSPPVRGKRGITQSDHGPYGSIPARAGETPWGDSVARADGVYPRPCGGNLTYSLESGPSWGLSPPVRGKRQRPRGL